MPVLALCAGCHAEPDEVVAAAQPPPPPPKRAPVALPACTAKADPEFREPFHDDFDRVELGDDWRPTGYGAYVIRAGRLCTARPRNHPLWLARKLPVNVRVEFDATPLTPNADVKAELFGDGCAFDVEGRDYTASGYVAVLGAHSNSEHWLARLAEHGLDAKKSMLDVDASTLATGKLTANAIVHVELARTDGHELRFLANGTPIHVYADSQPLAGADHDHFAFNGWEAPVCFDHLVITPLP